MTHLAGVVAQRGERALIDARALVTTNFLLGESDEDWLKPPATVAASAEVLGSRQVRSVPSSFTR